MPAMNVSGDLVKALGFFVGGTLVLVSALGERRSSRHSQMSPQRLWGLLLFAFASYFGSLRYVLAIGDVWNVPSQLDWVQVALIFAAALLVCWAWVDVERTNRRARQPQVFGPNAPTPYTGDSNEGEAHP